jgi:hypothetical protein
MAADLAFLTRLHGAQHDAVLWETPSADLARRKPGVQIPSPPPHNSPGHRPGGSLLPGRCRSKFVCRQTGSNPLSGCRGTVGPATGRYGAFGAALGVALLAGKMLPPRVVSELYHATSATWTEQPAGPALLPFVRSALNAHTNLDERLVDVNPAVVVTQLVRQARNRSPRWSSMCEVRALGHPCRSARTSPRMSRGRLTSP